KHGHAAEGTGDRRRLGALKGILGEHRSKRDATTRAGGRKGEGGGAGRGGERPGEGQNAASSTTSPDTPTW
ncbi:MAG TPA: hypothetical protein VM580_00925, partial [Labilithrix sp.]|nr:hypothetical protein [Labilithrix sp.]